MQFANLMLKMGVRKAFVADKPGVISILEQFWTVKQSGSPGGDSKAG